MVWVLSCKLKCEAMYARFSMRFVEATPAMISAAEAVLQHRSGETTDQEIVQAIWHAMVEAALDGRPCTTRH